jgi:outer membrane lipoprotein-sorting protein
MTKFIALILFSVFTISQIASAQVDDSQARKVLTEVANKAKTFTNLKFVFSYRMFNKEHGVDNALEGNIVMQKDMYNLHMMGRNVVSDGKTMWTYDPDAEELQISNADESKDAFSFLKMVTSIDDSYSAKLIKTITESGKSFYIIDLTPKTAKSYYKVRVKIDKTESWIQEATIFDKDNTEYTFTVVKFVSNLSLKPGYFTLKPTDFPDAEVVDLR